MSAEQSTAGDQIERPEPLQADDHVAETDFRVTGVGELGEPENDALAAIEEPIRADMLIEIQTSLSAVKPPRLTSYRLTCARLAGRPC
jgi:hypothetical protein